MRADLLYGLKLFSTCIGDGICLNFVIQEVLQPQLSIERTLA